MIKLVGVPLTIIKLGYTLLSQSQLFEVLVIRESIQEFYHSMVNKFILLLQEHTHRSHPLTCHTHKYLQWFLRGQHVESARSWLLGRHPQSAQSWLVPVQNTRHKMHQYDSHHHYSNSSHDNQPPWDGHTHSLAMHCDGHVAWLPLNTLQLVYQVNDWPTVSWGCGLGPFGEVELTNHTTVLGLNRTVTMTTMMCDHYDHHDVWPPFTYTECVRV